jgi:putative peptidoglycan lipid II flippase
VTGGVVAAVLLSQRPDEGAGAGPGTAAPTTGSSQPVPPPSGGPLTIRDARDFDPQGDPDTENPDQVELAYDGKPTTRWETLTYRGNPELGGLKRGVGLVLDLGTAQPVSSVELALSGNGTEVEVRVPKDEPEQVTSPPMASDNRWRTVSKDEVDDSGTLALKSPVTTRFVLVYLRSLPREGSGYKGGIYEVEVNS